MRVSGCWRPREDWRGGQGGQEVEVSVDLIQTSNFGIVLAVEALVKPLWCDFSRAELQVTGSRPGTNLKLSSGRCNSTTPAADTPEACFWNVCCDAGHELNRMALFNFPCRCICYRMCMREVGRGRSRL